MWLSGKGPGGGEYLAWLQNMVTGVERGGGEVRVVGGQMGKAENVPKVFWPGHSEG